MWVFFTILRPVKTSMRFIIARTSVRLSSSRIIQSSPDRIPPLNIADRYRIPKGILLRICARAMQAAARHKMPEAIPHPPASTATDMSLTVIGSTHLSVCLSVCSHSLCLHQLSVHVVFLYYSFTVMQKSCC